MNWEPTNTLLTMPFNWSFNALSQNSNNIDINQKYREIAKEFIDKYVNLNLPGIASIEQCYDSDSLISFHIHQGNNNHLFELVGYTAFKNKLAEKNITLIKYHNLTYTSQPVGKNCVMITMYCKANINNINYNASSTFIIRITGTIGKIINQVLEIFI